MQTVPRKPTAYSYIRFSRPEQMGGDSLNRQTTLSERFARENGLTLSPLTYQDLGISGFKGKNVTAGELGKFLRAVETGEIASGSWLLVEAHDRITRAGPAEAIPLLMQITNAGITIAFIAKNRVIDRETLRKSPFVFYEILSDSILAYQESSQKSDRLCRAWASKRRKAAEENKPITSRCPAWLDLTKDGFRVIEGQDTIVQRIFAMAASGHGKRSIANVFNAEDSRQTGRNQPSCPKRGLDSQSVSTHNEKLEGVSQNTDNTTLTRCPSPRQAIGVFRGIKSCRKQSRIWRTNS